jgi:hypothetical protein
VEDDRDFRGDRRAKPKAKFEEIDIGSDESEIDEDATGGQPLQKRRSEWRSRKHEGDDDLPDELPENFKDGSVNVRQRDRERERAKERAERRKTVPAALKASKIRPAAMRASTGGIGEGGNGITSSGGRKRGRPSKSDAQARVVEIARAAMVEDENRKAKLVAAGINYSDKDKEDAQDSADDSRAGFTPVNRSNGPSVGRKSIFNKSAGPGGRKIKVVAKKKVTETVEIPDDNSSSSEGDIPSAMLTRKGPPGRRNLPDIVV